MWSKRLWRTGKSPRIFYPHVMYLVNIVEKGFIIYFIFARLNRDTNTFGQHYIGWIFYKEWNVLQKIVLGLIIIFQPMISCHASQILKNYMFSYHLKPRLNTCNLQCAYMPNWTNYHVITCAFYIIPLMQLM
jgi:hypothetical protein